MGVHPAQGAEPKKPFLNAGDHQPNLVDVGIQQQAFGVGLPAAAHADDTAAAVDGHLVHQGPEQLRRRPCRRSLKA